MGYAIAKAAARRGAEVVLVSGPTALPEPQFVNTVHVQSAQEMFDAVMHYAPKADIIVKAAAVADYRPATVADNKLKKREGEFTIPLERTADILAALPFGGVRDEHSLPDGYDGPRGIPSSAEAARRGAA